MSTETKQPPTPFDLQLLKWYLPEDAPEVLGKTAGPVLISDLVNTRVGHWSGDRFLTLWGELVENPVRWAALPTPARASKLGYKPSALAVKEARARIAPEVAQLNELIGAGRQAGNRLAQIRNGFYSSGEEKRLEYMERDWRFPIWNPGVAWNVVRLVDVDARWVTLRGDGSDEVKRYSRASGRRERTRTAYDTIEIGRAEKLWEDTRAEREAGTFWQPPERN